MSRKHDSTGKFTRCHGEARDGQRTPEYSAWQAMLARTVNPKRSPNGVSSETWSRYGGRGIAVSKRWLKFENFLVDMGRRPTAKHSIERIDNNKGYTKSNCKWATRKEQQRNTSRNHLVTARGVTATLAEWIERTGLKWSTLWYRIDCGWPVEKALFTPADTHNKKIRFQEQSRTISQWAKRVGLTPAALIQRFALGWSTERALTQKRKNYPSRRVPR